MIKRYEILTTIHGFKPAMEGDPIQVVLSEQFLERCGVERKHFKELHQLVFELDMELDCIQASVPVSGGRENVYYAFSPDDAPEIADAVLYHLLPPKRKLRLVPNQ